jgi:WD40 repeat protein
MSVLKDNGLEIFLLNGKMHFFSFENTEDRNRAHHILLSHKLPNFVNYEDETKGSILKYSVTRKWQEGLMTNFQYLMHLNKMAGRTFNDLMQYPVFPYVLADYKSEKLDLSKSQTFRDLSKPISIQDESKIEKYVTNYEFLEGEYKRASEEEKGSIVPVPYHYGSHFSNSGIVLHYLVRVFPYTKMFLDYQDKHFDVPDRTFHNMESTWRLVSSESPSDVKEMIPEFYYLPEFLVNLEGFDFGQRQTGEQVSDVLLPLWAHGDERLFILKHRQALECDYVSRNLHKWIDLVFGYKQAGPAAIEAVNVFHPSTYFGAVDIERITDEVQRNAVKAQIQSYGQSPKQLFDSSHPSRTSPSHLSFFTGGPEHFDVLEGCDKSIPIFTTLPMSTTSAHDFKDKWCQFAFLGPLIRCSVGVLWSKTFSGAIGSLHLLSSGEIDALSPKMAFIQVSGESSKGDGQRGAISWGFYDGSVRIRLKGLSETYLPYWPQSKMITCCGVTKNRQLLFGDSDGVVTVWTLQVDAKSTSGLSVCEGYTLLPGHQTAILCLAVCQDFSIWVTGSQGGDCVIWDLNRLSYIRSVPSQSKPVSSIAISSTLGDIAVAYGAVENPCGHDSQSKSELLVWSINAAFVSRRNLGSVQVNCLAYSSAAEGVRINVVAAGTDLGKIRIFSSWDLTPLFDVGCAEIKRPITSVMFSKDSWELYGATTEGCVVAWKSQHS